MKNKIHSLNSLIIVTITALFVGCSSSKTTHADTETTVSRNADGSTDTRTEVVTKEKEKSESCGGLASCTVDAAGTILAAPFKATGAIVEGAF